MARKTSSTDASSAVAYMPYNPQKQQDYFYAPNIEISDRVEYSDATGTELLTRGQFIDWVSGKYGTYEAWLNTLTARDRRTKASLGPSGKRPWWGADEAAYHRVVRANQRRLDGQPPVDEATVSLAAMTDTSSTSGGASGAGGSGGMSGYDAAGWMKQNQTGVIIGVGALALLLIITRKR